MDPVRNILFHPLKQYIRIDYLTIMELASIYGYQAIWKTYYATFLLTETGCVDKSIYSV